jgi:hypothetical protein
MSQNQEKNRPVPPILLLHTVFAIITSNLLNLTSFTHTHTHTHPFIRPPTLFVTVTCFADDVSDGDLKSDVFLGVRRKIFDDTNLESGKSIRDPRCVQEHTFCNLTKTFCQNVEILQKVIRIMFFGNRFVFCVKSLEKVAQKHNNHRIRISQLTMVIPHHLKWVSGLCARDMCGCVVCGSFHTYAHKDGGEWSA